MKSAKAFQLPPQQPTSPTQAAHTPKTISESTLLQKFELLERKYKDLKVSKQKLFDYITKREQEHKLEIEAFKSKLDENIKLIRKLEDEKLNLGFEVTNLKQKETKSLEYINTLKVFVTKYSTKDKDSEFPSLPKTPKEISFTGQKEGPTLRSPNQLVLEIPREKLSLKPLPSRLLSVPEGCEESPYNAGLLSPESGYANGSASFKENNYKSKGSALLEKETDLIRVDLLGRGKSAVQTLNGTQQREERDTSIEMKKKKVSRSMQRYYSPEPEDSPKKKLKRRSSLSFKRGRSASSSWLEGKDYLSRFNTLSQSIVSLGVKPEIAIDNIGKMMSSGKKDRKEDSPTQCGEHMKKSSVRYVSKSSQEYIELMSSQQLTPKGPVPKGVEIQHHKKLFEDFLVIGVDKSDLRNYSKQHPEKKSGRIKPKILYKYAQEGSSLHESSYNSITDFAFPFGVQIYKLRSTPSFSALNPIIYVSAEGDMHAKCFVFPILSGNLVDGGAKMGDVIDSSNPNHLLYIVCIAFKDFISMSDSSKPKKSANDVKYWEVKKMMCFITYYPLNNFFFDVLIKFLDILKVERMMQISQTDPDDLERHKNIDSRFTSKFFDALVRKNLDDILSVKKIDFSSQLEFKINGNFMENKVSLQIPDQNRAFTMESDWACLTVFDFLPLKDLLWLFTAMMLERKLVFVSKNLYLLTATLSVVHSLLKPFKYPFPLIFNLPEILMVICDAPGAALIGLNKGEDFVKNQRLLEEYPSCIVVCLDEGKFYMERDGAIELPPVDSLEKSLVNSYVKVNPSLTRRLVDSRNKTAQGVKGGNVRYAETPEERNNCVKVLELFREKLKEKIIAYVPQEPIYQSEKQLDFGALGKKTLENAISMPSGVDKRFLKHFVKTQIFAYFLESFYPKK